MRFVNYSFCPHCACRVELSLNARSFECPVCGCRFRHSYRKLLVVIPLVAVFAFVFWLVFDFPRNAIGGGVGGVVSATFVLFTTVWPTYIIVSAGKDFPKDARAANWGTQQHTRRLMTVMIVVAVVLVILGILLLRLLSVL